MNLNFKSFGQGPPVVILHGLFGMLDNWQSVAKELAENYSVFIVDQRNHGRSPHTDDFSYSLMAEDLHLFLEQQWIFKCHLIGHSMGGKTAMQFALQYPDMVERLIIVDIGPERNEGNHDLIYEALLSLPIDEIESRKEAEDFLAEKIKDFGTRQFLLKNLSRKKEGGFRWRMNLPVLHARYDEVLKGVTGDQPFGEPTLFIRGGNSDYLPAQLSPAITRLFPEANLVTIEKAGHWVHAEQPAAFVETVKSFLVS